DRPGRSRGALLPDEPRPRPRGRRAPDRRGLLRRRLPADQLRRASRAGPADAAREAAVTASDVHTRLDVERIRADFPILAREIDGRPIAYLDSANSAQKPRQ